MPMFGAVCPFLSTFGESCPRFPKNVKKYMLIEAPRALDGVRFFGSGFMVSGCRDSPTSLETREM